MRVRQIDTALDLFERFARERKPMTLTVIARELAIPKSSAFNIIETLLVRGYLHETRPRGGYYPTLLLADLARHIVGDDLLIQQLHPDLEALADESGETVLLSAREHNEIVYLDVVESVAPIRYTARIGQRRPIHTTSSGKAILLSYEDGERRAIAETLGDELADDDVEPLLTDLATSAARGWTEDSGQTMEGVTAFGAPILAGRWRLGLAIAGPSYRMDPAREKLLRLLLGRSRKIVEALRDST